MPTERAILNRLLGEAEAALDWAKYQIRRRREPRVFHIQPYHGHGTTEWLYVSGRVFEGQPVPPARAEDAVVRNLWHAIRRMGSDEVPAARVAVSTNGVSTTALAGDDGFFEVRLPVHTPDPATEVWREVRFELVDPRPIRGPAVATALAIVPPRSARFGIISDIDDTVVQSDVANLLRLLRLVLLTNAHARPPFPGVAAFYRALHAGVGGASDNPIFYVSSSPWNFYDLLMEILEVHDLPAGPLFLKDYGLAPDLLLARGHEEHKLGAIETILAAHPGLRFILVGDSGQRDPEIYSEVVQRHPNRVETIYIRDVSNSERDAEVRRIATNLSAYGVEVVLVQHTVSAAEHAAARGLIDAALLPEIRGQRAEDLVGGRG